MFNDLMKFYTHLVNYTSESIFMLIQYRYITIAKLHILKSEQRTVKKRIDRTKHLMTNLERDMKDI